MPTQNERNAETRRRLLSAAREMFADQGYAQSSVADIVKRAERAHGSFYLHFANKEAALQALLEIAMARMSDESKSLWRWDEPGSSVRETVHRFVELYGEDRDLWLLLDERSNLEPAFRTMSDLWFEQVASSILHGMVSTETPGLVPGLDPEILARVFAAMLFDSTRAMFQENPRWTPDELADEISRIWSLTLGYADAPASS